MGLTCLLRHPEVATRSCSECKLWVFDESGAKSVGRGGRHVRRTGLPPCRLCPKKSPEFARHYELNGRNLATVDLYYATRAMSGSNLTEEQKSDQRLISALAMIDRIVRPYEAEQATSSVLTQMRLIDLQGERDSRIERQLR